MKSQVLYAICSLAALALACSAVTFNLNTPTQAPANTQPVQVTSTAPTNIPPTTAPATPEPPVLPPTATPIPAPTLTPTIAPSPTPSEPMLTTIDKPVNCRFGPGMEYAVVSYLLLGESTRLEGKAADVNWWYIRTPQNPSLFCWVAASVTVASGNLALVNIVPPPDVLVTAVSLKLDPTDITVPGCTFPYEPVTMTGTITTNGPAIVEWHWETSQGHISSSEMTKFSKFGAQTVSDYVKYSAAGDYWVKLVITSPNSKVAKAEYKVSCGP